MTIRKEKLKGRLKAWMSRGSASDNYGFGANWSLNIGRQGVPQKSFWLGQGGKVTSRMIGIDYGNYVKQVQEQAGIKKQFSDEGEWLGHKKINKIVTEDVLHSVLGDEYTYIGRGEGVWEGEINSKRLKKLLKAQSWDLGVQ